MGSVRPSGFAEALRQIVHADVLLERPEAEGEGETIRIGYGEIARVPGPVAWFLHEPRTGHTGPLRERVQRLDAVVASEVERDAEALLLSGGLAHAHQQIRIFAPAQMHEARRAAGARYRENVLKPQHFLVPAR